MTESIDPTALAKGFKHLLCPRCTVHFTAAGLKRGRPVTLLNEEEMPTTVVISGHCCVCGGMPATRALVDRFELEIEWFMFSKCHFPAIHMPPPGGETIVKVMEPFTKKGEKTLPPRFVCVSCEKTYNSKDDLVEIRRAAIRIKEGDPTCDGECPSCGGLCFMEGTPPSNPVSEGDKEPPF